MTGKSKSENKSTVRAVERSLDILKCFIDSTELGLTEIADRISLHKSTVHRMVYTLEKKGFLMKNPDTDKYRLGFSIWELSANLIGIDDPATLFLPEMQMLRDTLEETISLYVRDGYERIRIQSVESKKAIRRVAPIGMRLPLSIGASSKVLIAFEDVATQNSILDQLEKQYAVNRSEFLEVICLVRKKGYATSFEEREIGISAISCPIFNRHHRVIAALTVSGPVNRLTKQRMEEIAIPLQKAADRMTKMLKIKSYETPLET